MPVGRAVRISTRSELHSGAYHLATWPWVKLFGDSDTALRSLSVVFGVVAVVLLMVLARHLFGTRTAFLVAPIFLVHAQTIRHFQEARTYSLAMVGAIAATLLFVRALDVPESRRRWLAYGAGAALCCYAHLFVVYVLASHVLVLLVRRALPPGRLLVPTAAAFVVVAAPLAIYPLSGARRHRLGAGHDARGGRPRRRGAGGRPRRVGVGGARCRALGVASAAGTWERSRPDADGRRRVVGGGAVRPRHPGFAREADVRRALPAREPAGGRPPDGGRGDALIDRVNVIAGVAVLVVVLTYNGWFLVDWYEGRPAKEDFRTAMAFACTEAGDDGVVTGAPEFLLELAVFYEDDTCGTSDVTDRIVTVVRLEEVSPPDGWRATGFRQFAGGIQVHTFER